jgi:hypothetical protein
MRMVLKKSGMLLRNSQRETNRHKRDCTAVSESAICLTVLTFRS